jgi:hypothetical protein
MQAVAGFLEAHPNPGDDADHPTTRLLASCCLAVGMTNATGLEATDLKARFGDAIAIVQDDEVESLAAAAGDPVRASGG